LVYHSAVMKFVFSIIAVSGIAITSCERHDFKETKKLHEQHESQHADTKSHESTTHDDSSHAAKEKAEH